VAKENEWVREEFNLRPLYYERRVGHILLQLNNSITMINNKLAAPTIAVRYD
jgi:hypothetical protein